ncbi:MULTISPECIES: shikimate dehydrogenase [unclassified Rhizobium]|uniref:shikimate dehydrogenase family protein n=1 Tax=unclassified Rhizobium TaxID=2613769 RepID=UPI00146AF41A|nr:MULTISPECIES: shikimate dehydrogenase [unclassified Rhizobium]MBD9454991.1 shikimate dehydrogenase [Rhizobium sp. RHZ02]NMN71518.1 shikimate 5-dehydrogenase [Rhizobium sp. 57MFTsu3.2]
MSYISAARRTMYFIGVTTGKSSIMKVFPAWSRHLGLDAEMKGIDFAPNSDPAAYRAAVEFIKADPLSLGALVTTHKVNLLKASRALFDELDPYAMTLHEISSISKRGDRLVGHAKDPITAGASFEAIVPDGYWARTGASLCILGSGGSSLALTLYLHNKVKSGGDVPSTIVVTARREASLAEMRHVHEEIGFAIPIEYRLAPGPAEADRIVGDLPDASMVVNATGLGKDGPGSPLSDAVSFPKDGLVWEFNYRGDLVFLDQAKAAAEARGLTVHDGWVYFIHGWTRVIAEVFDINIPMSGPAFDDLSRIARDVSQ